MSDVISRRDGSHGNHLGWNQGVARKVKWVEGRCRKELEGVRKEARGGKVQRDRKRMRTTLREMKAILPKQPPHLYGGC